MSFIQINGRFVIPTQAQLEALDKAILPKELIATTNLPLDAKIEIVGEKKEVWTDDTSELKSLRAEYKEKTGNKPFHWWTEEQLKEKLAS